MATKKPYSRHTNSADRRKYEGTPVPSIQPIVKPNHKKDAPVPQPPMRTQHSVNPKPPTVNQTSTASPTPKHEGTESAKKRPV